MELHRKAERGGDKEERKTEKVLAARKAIIVCEGRELRLIKLRGLKNKDFSLLGVGVELLTWIWFLDAVRERENENVKQKKRV